jgi:hypothetical protein
LNSSARRVAWWALAIVVVVSGSGLRAYVDGSAELRKAEAARAEGELDDLVMHLGRAARWRLPLATHDERALEELEALALGPRAAEDPTLAILACREIRRALLATRTPMGVSDPELLDRAERGVVRLMSVDTDPERDDRLAIQLSEPRDAPNAGTWLASFFFVAWLGALYGFFSRGIDDEASLIPKAARLWGLLVLLTTVSWMLLTRHPEWISALG